MTPSLCLHFTTKEVEQPLSGRLRNACLCPLSLFLLVCWSFMFRCSGSFLSWGHHPSPYVPPNIAYVFNLSVAFLIK